MKIVHFFRREAEVSSMKLIVAVLAAGLSDSFMIMIINTAAGQIANDALETRLFLLFIVIFTMFVFTQHYSITHLSIAIEKIILKMRVRIADKIRHADLFYIEHNGISKIYTQLINNSDVLSDAGIELSFMAQSALLAVICIIYLGFLSPLGLVLYLVVFGVGAYAYLIYDKEVTDKFSKARHTDTAFLSTLNHVLDGFKELKFNHVKSDAVVEELNNIAKEAEILKSDIKQQQSVLLVYGRSVFYVLLGTMVFIVPIFTVVNSEQIHELVATNLFIIGPISAVVGMVPVLNRVNAAVTNLENLEMELDMVKEQSAVQQVTPTFQSLQLKDIRYDYEDDAGEVLFSVQNINLELTIGEMLFIVGGNGSGKTTFLKLLTGLYVPNEGIIELNGKKLKKSEYQNYRQLFATIFTDFHMFDKLYGISHVSVEQVNELLEKMELSHKTNYQGGRFTHTDLSTGQRKRLAFVSTYLEDKPIYIFDELAADQDPQFRQRFYEIILPELKSQGKTVIAVTHDDKYFHIADRVLKMDSGCIVPYTAS